MNHIGRKAITDFIADGAAMEALVLNAVTLSSHTFEFRTGDEGWCSAYITEIPRTSAVGPLEAVTILSALELCWLEEWHGVTAKDAANIVNIWLIPAFRRHKFLVVDASEAMRLINSSFEPILAGFHDASFKNCQYFRNGMEMALTTSFTWPNTPISGGMILQDEWNEEVVLWETEDCFGLYSWGTSA